jgi:hypothetical protein
VPGVFRHQRPKPRVAKAPIQISRNVDKWPSLTNHRVLIPIRRKLPDASSLKIARDIVPVSNPMRRVKTSRMSGACRPIRIAPTQSIDTGFGRQPNQQVGSVSCDLMGRSAALGVQLSQIRRYI